MRIIILLFAAVMLTGCDRPLVAYNGCLGSWIRIRDGRGNLLAERINYGLEQELDVDGYAGSNLELIAVGFDQANGRPLGSATTSRYIPNSRWGSMLGSQMQPWQITSLHSSDPNAGCSRR